jgi:hypothetical protein
MRAMSLVLLLLAAASPLAAQDGAVAVERETLRAEPAGRAIATLTRGTPLHAGREQDGWREVTLEAWIWAQSIRPEQRDGHDHVVSARGGENLRAEPGGPILGRAATGMLLDLVERRDGWVRVRRTAWLPQAAVTTRAAGPAGTASPPARTATRGVDHPSAGAAPGPAAAAPAAHAAGATAAAAVPARTAAAAPPTRPDAAGTWTLAGDAGTAVLSAPGSDTLARLHPFASVEVVARDGNWARVRLDGWVWAPSLRAAGDTTGVVRDATPELLTASPDAFRGRLVELRLQFIALDRAEKIRTDFYEGEPFILARAVAGAAGFVYIAVPEELTDQVRRTAPLSRIRILARVRTGRSQLTGAPVLELVEIRPADG